MTNGLGVLKKFAVNLGVGAAIAIVRGYLNGLLKDVEPNDLYASILENKDLWSITPDNIKLAGGGYKGKFHSLFVKYQDRITTELLLKWMREDHPALYSTILNTNIPRPGAGLIWFDLQVRKIKQKLIEM